MRISRRMVICGGGGGYTATEKAIRLSAVTVGAGGAFGQTAAGGSGGAGGSGDGGRGEYGREEE